MTYSQTEHQLARNGIFALLATRDTSLTLGKGMILAIIQ